MLKVKEPILPIYQELLHNVNHVTQGLAMDYFVSGAMARVLILYHVYELNTGRMTEDIDLAMVVESWDKYQALKDELKDRYCFEDGRAAHRLIYTGNGGEKALLDLVPFGEIESNNQIEWPPDQRFKMNMLGFKEAMSSPELLEFNDGLTIKVASLPSQAVLKIIAWNDRRHSFKKDAYDLIHLCKEYHRAGNADRLYKEDFGILEEFGYEVEFAGAKLLGMDAARNCRPTTFDCVQGIFADANLKQTLIDQGSESLIGEPSTRRVFAEKLLGSFVNGLIPTALPA